jgi:hypothetical protein
MQANSKVPIYPDLAGKVAVVTGGSGGIGAATCRLLAANGARVAVNGRDQARIDTVVDAIRATGGEAIGVAGDCTQLTAVEAMRQQVEQDLGPVVSWLQPLTSQSLQESRGGSQPDVPTLGERMARGAPGCDDRGVVRVERCPYGPSKVHCSARLLA